MPVVANNMRRSAAASGVLGGEHVEGTRHVMADAGHGDVMLLHGLEQRGLSLGAGAVDLVGHQELGEDRSFDEAEAAPPGRALLQHFRAHDVGGHQIRRELDALVLESEHGAERLDQTRLGKAGHADQKRVSAGEQRNQGKVDHALLAENGGSRGLADFFNLGANLLDTIDELGFGFSKCCHGFSLARSWSMEDYRAKGR
jgi:hypothetical protein